MTLAAGTRLGAYDVVAPLGAGAMGEVYRARDTRLGREVALKVLPEHFADDEERLKRFEREARTLASLNHPNVGQIFGVDQVGDTCFLVLELVEGETLEQRLARGPLSIEEALDVCRQIAEGLEAAHEAGVIHRDLKPANVRVMPDGRVKVLDFGLAKPARLSSETRSTDSVLSTEQGRLLGTPTYMAPEQARGKAIDRRIDVWAFGCVLYECLTGVRAFEGETLSDVLSSVLRSEADLQRLPAGTPASVRELLSRCLHKDPRQRLRDVGEARLVLERAAEEEPAASASASTPRRGGVGGYLPWAACALLALALVVVLARGRGAASDAGPASVRTAVRLPPGVRLELETNVGETSLLAISPDGSELAFIASDGAVRRLYLRALDPVEARAEPGSEEAHTPFFSPDGRWVAFTARGRLWKAPVDGGGAPVDLCAAEVGRGGCWGPDGTLVIPAGIATGLVRIPSSGGRPEVLTELDASKRERTHRWPSFLPGGGEVVYTVGVEGKSGDYEDSEIEVVSLATGETRALGLQASFVRPTEAGWLLFARHGRVSAVRLADLGGERAPEPVVVLQDVAGVPDSGVAHFDVARNGTLVYAEKDPHAREGELAWVTRDGRCERLALPARAYSMPAVSPDGTKIAVTIGPVPGADSDVWIHDLSLGSIARLTSDGASVGTLWTPDGKRLTYCTSSDGASPGAVIVTRAGDGRGEPTVVRRCDSGEFEVAQAWTPDEEELVYLVDSGPPNSADLFAWSLRGQSSRAVLASAAIEYAGMVSPDGKWIALASFEGGRSQIWVQALHGEGARWPITDSGAYPCWSRAGDELFYVDGQNMMSVPVRTEPAFAAGRPERLFTLEFPTATATVRNWDVAPDGRFLVVLRTSEESKAGHLNLVQHGLDELR